MRPTQAPTVLVIPESAQLDLIQMRDHLRLLAQLTETGTVASQHDNLLRPDSLAWWFTRLARDLEEIVDSTYWSSAVAQSASHPT